MLKYRLKKNEIIEHIPYNMFTKDLREEYGNLSGLHKISYQFPELCNINLKNCFYQN
jgi:hypothetical protein